MGKQRNNQLCTVEQLAILLTQTKNVNVDLAFVIGTTGSMPSAIRNVKNNITTFATYLEEKGVSLRVAIIEYRDIT